MVQQPGLLALFGSGETSASGRRVYEWVFSRLPSPIRVAVLETPAGFQPNSTIVARKIGDFLEERLQNYRPRIDVVPARQRANPFSTDDPDLLDPVLRSNVLFMGPGSPSYAIRHLRGSLAWGYLQAQQRMGSALLLASAATIAVGAHSLPVYEIYKVGEEPHWQPGLDFFGPYGLSLTFVPHWNNSEGGAELDTSHCFMGRVRFQRLLELLPPKTTVVGIDEHTALVVDLAAATCRVIGRGVVTLLREGEEARFANGRSFPADRLGPFRTAAPREGISPEAWERALGAREEPSETSGTPDELLAMVQRREEARARRDWPAADAIRAEIAESGWRINDTPDGPLLEPA
ncbi:MAG: type 1 glutamine amidotransferase family protein [Chloroflexota bacterium]